MGLDNFWVGADGERASVPGVFKVTGGMLSDNGNSAFRGKKYAFLVEALTGVSLYQERITSGVVREMSARLGASQWSPLFAVEHDIDETEFGDLVKMFRAHAEEGHTLCGWW